MDITKLEPPIIGFIKISKRRVSHDTRKISGPLIEATVTLDASSLGQA